MIDFNFETNNELKAGSVLVSEPFLADNYFTRSVIYLCDHNADGSFGFVLNKHLDGTLGELGDNLPNIESRVSLGGPVDTSNLFYVHSLGDEVPNSIPCAKGLFIGGEFEAVKRILEEDPTKINQIRFFIGYSGWEKGQLEHELEEKSWIVLNNISKDQILNADNEGFWKKIMESLGGKFKVMSKFPINPSDN